MQNILRNYFKRLMGYQQQIVEGGFFVVACPVHWPADGLVTGVWRTGPTTVPAAPPIK